MSKLRPTKGANGVRRPNVWHVVICEQLRTAGGPLTIKQIWAGVEASGFQHASKLPRSTLSGRVAELVQMKRLERVGPAIYQLSPEPPLAAEVLSDLSSEVAL